MKLNLWPVLPAAYALVAVYTFGHAFVDQEQETAARCKATPPRDAQEEWLCRDKSNHALLGVMSATTWPLYWSVQFSRAKVAQHEDAPRAPAPPPPRRSE